MCERRPPYLVRPEPTPLRCPNPRRELRALLERRRQLWAELGDLDAMIVGVVTEIAERQEG